MAGRIIFLLADAWSVVCCARMLLQWAGLNYMHPLAQFCVRFTEWPVRLLRRVLPPVGRWDTSCLLAVWLLYYAAFCLSELMYMKAEVLQLRFFAVNVLFSLLYLTKALACALLLVFVVRAVLGFAGGFQPLLPVLRRLTDPLTLPFSFLRLGQLDFSAAVAVLLLLLWLGDGVPYLATCLDVLLLLPG